MLRSYLTKIFIGFSYGLSFPLTMIVLDYWLKDSGISNASIGLFSFLHLPFMLKFFWGMFIDNYDIPFLSTYLNRNKSWLIVSYLTMICGILIMIIPPQSHCIIFFGASLIALADGCRNVILYPYQIMNSPTKSFGFIASFVGLGHRLGSIFIKVTMLHIAHIYSWQLAYSFAIICLIVLMIFTLFIKDPANTTHNQLNSSFFENFYISFRDPLQKLIKTSHGSKILMVVCLYKIADFMIQKMSRPFCIEIGFSKYDIANTVQFYGSITVIIGSFIGAYLIKKFGLIRSMKNIAIIHASCFFMYLLLVFFGHSIKILTFIVTAEGFSGAMTACFLAFFYTISKNASMYAVLWAIHEFFGLLSMGISGIIVDYFGWSIFFTVVPLLIMPSLLVLREISEVNMRNVDL